MLKRFCRTAALLVSLSASADAGYLDENPNEVFAEVYARLGIQLPVRAARDAFVWLRLEELKREPCDQKSVADLSLALEAAGYRREAAESVYNFVRKCGAPVGSLHRAIDILLKLSDYPKVVEVADEFMRLAPSNANAHYLRGVGFSGTKDYRRALTDYADAIELYGADRKSISSLVFTRMAEAYAGLGQFCEAVTPILTWVALDPAARDNSRSQRIVADYEQRGNCASVKAPQIERYPLNGSKNTIMVKADVNGTRGVFILDTGASFVSLKSSFAARAKVPPGDGYDITLVTANGHVKAKLSKADKVALGKLEAASVPVVIQAGGDTVYGRGVDGLLGMSFLSRFELQMAGGFIEVRARSKK